MAKSSFDVRISGKVNFTETHQSEELGNVTEYGRLAKVTTTPEGHGDLEVQIAGTYEADDRLIAFLEKAMEMDSRNLELLLPVVEKVALAYFKR